MPPIRAAACIEEALVRMGALNVSKEYNGERELVGITFRLVEHDLPLVFKLFANVDGVEAVLRMDESGKKRRKSNSHAKTSIRNQAAMTAWKLLYDEVAVKAARVMIENTSPLRAFLADVCDRSGNTFFEGLQSGNISGFKALTSGQ